MSRVRDIANILSGGSSTIATDAEITSAISDQFMAGKNKLINGNFAIWQRGSSLTPTTGQVYTTDRFLALRDGSGATVTVSRQTFTPNAAGNPTGAVNGNNYFYRQSQSVAGSGGTYNLMEQRVEGAVLAGQTVTFSFWAKAAASLTLPQIDYEYTIGATNTSANVTSNIAVTTSWQRFSYTFTIPTYSGLTPSNTSDFFGIRIWFPSNTTFTFDTWGWQLEAGSSATAFQTATGTLQGELAACQRYYETGNAFFRIRNPSIGDNHPFGSLGGTGFQVLKRTLPTIVLGTPTATNCYTNSGNTINISTASFEQVLLCTTGGTQANMLIFQPWTASAEI
jgi:hypothetical protein